MIDTVHVREPLRLMERLEESGPLESFVKLYSSRNSSRLLWKCFVVANGDDGLMLVFTPCFVCCTQRQKDTPPDHLEEDVPLDDVSLDQFSTFPVVFMHTTLPHLLGEDSSVGGCLPLPPDAHHDCTFGTSKSNDQLPRLPGACIELFKKTKHIHTLAYLHALQNSLSHGWSLTTPTDLDKGLSVCTRAELSVNLTPLLMGVCHHCATDTGKVTLEMLASLLETLGDQRHHTYSVSFPDDLLLSESKCLLREKDITDLVRSFLEEKGFIEIQGSGYYWFREDRSTQYREVNSLTSYSLLLLFYDMSYLLFLLAFSVVFY